jgi:hypothetical protein
MTYSEVSMAGIGWPELLILLVLVVALVGVYLARRGS